MTVGELKDILSVINPSLTISVSPLIGGEFVDITQGYIVGGEFVLSLDYEGALRRESLEDLRYMSENICDSTAAELIRDIIRDKEVEERVNCVDM